MKLQEFTKLGITLTIRDGDLYATGNLTDDVKGLLKQHKDALIKELRDRAVTLYAPPGAVPRLPYRVLENGWMEIKVYNWAEFQKETACSDPEFWANRELT